jgi:capsule polysaccharide export protein KpsE/RkpR
VAVSTQPGMFAHDVASARSEAGSWSDRARLLWWRRKLLLRALIVSAPLSVCAVMLIPNQYESAARIMPPDTQSPGASMLAALATRTGSLGALGTMAGGLLGGRPTTALFMSLLQSGTVSGRLIQRFHLQAVYHKRYAVDAGKTLARHTKITDDKRSGVITIEVEDHDPVRARNLAQAYLDELNRLVIETNNSSAHQERVFIEQRLRSVTADLDKAQNALSEYSSRNNAVDLKEQTRAMVDAGARVEAALVMEQSTLNSLRQVYGDQNARVREAEARVGTLQRELNKVAGSSAHDDGNESAATAAPTNELYPALRQLPRLAVPYANLYRSVRVQETLYELLTQQYETARIDEAKDIPAVAVIDRPAVPEKKSFPPRAVLALLLTLTAIVAAAVWIMMSQAWADLPGENGVRVLIREIRHTVRASEETVA